MGLLDWLGIGGGQDPAQAAPGLLGGDTRGIRNQAFYSALMPIAAGLLAHGQRRPVGSPSPLPEALAAFGPTYQRGLLGGYQQQALERQAGEAERFNQMIAALPPDQQQQARLMGPERYGAYVAQRQLQDSDPRRRFMAVGTHLVDLNRFGGGGGSPTGQMMAGQPGAAPGAASGAMPPAVAGGRGVPGSGVGREVPGQPGVYSFAAPQAAGAGGPPGTFRGTSMEAQDSNILLRGDPNSPEYAMAYARQSQPRVQMVPNPDPAAPPGSLIQAEIRPDMSHVRQPTYRVGAEAPTQSPRAPIAATQGGYVAGGAPPALDLASGLPTRPGDPTTRTPTPPATTGRVAPIEGTSRPPQPTGEQQTVAGYATRMEEAERLFRNIERSGYSPGNLRDAAAARAGLPGNYMMSNQGQQYQQAQMDWVRAKLRRESGAVISEQEMADEIRTYFPQPGDSPETIRQKAQARRVAQRAMAQGAGVAYRARQIPSAEQMRMAPIQDIYDLANEWDDLNADQRRVVRQRLGLPPE